MYRHDIKMFKELWSIRQEVWAIVKDCIKALPGALKADALLLVHRETHPWVTGTMTKEVNHG